MRFTEWWVNSALIVAVLVGLAGYVQAADSAEIGKLLRDSQNQLFAGKADQADQTLQKAEAMMAEILAGSDETEKGKAKSVQGRVEKLRKDIDKKLGKTASGAAPPAADSPKPAAAAGEKAPGELPSYVRSSLTTLSTTIGDGENELAKGEVRNARRAVDRARDQLAKFDRGYSKYVTPDHAEYSTVKKRLEALDIAVAKTEAGKAGEKAAAEQAEADAKTSSTLWLARLKPFTAGPGQPDHDPKKYFIGSYTEDQAEMNERARILGLVQEAMDSYDKSGFGDNATEDLQQVVRQLKYQIQSFQESFASMADVKVKNATQHMEHQLKKADAEVKKIGTDQLPLPVGNDALQTIRRDLDRAAIMLGEQEPRVAALRDQYNKLVEMNAKLVRARIAETRMVADKFGGSETKAVKAKAVEIATEKKPGLQILRTTVISPDWTEENVVEWTDTTHSAVRHRVTQAVSAQIAGKKDGETKLYTLHIARDRRSGGSWGPLYGHIMFEDAILEENVAK